MAHKQGICRHTREFSRRSRSYLSSNIIQNRAAKRLIEGLGFHPQKILDLGCGAGAVYRQISWPLKRFTAVDKAERMCRLHPRSSDIEVLHADFEDPKLFQRLAAHAPYDLIVSSSALQWASDLPTLLKRMSALGDRVAFAIFCSGTFRTLRRTAGLDTFLPELHELKALLNRHFDARYETWEEKLFFPDTLSALRYIKRSGVSGGRRHLCYHETKRLIAEYPLEYLEFEVLFVWGEIKR